VPWVPSGELGAIRARAGRTLGARRKSILPPSGPAFSYTTEEVDSRERRFIARLRARDERAFNELVTGYQQPIFGLVLRLLGGRREEARDVTQEVFVQVFKSIDQFRGDAAVSTWVYRIAVNLSKNRVRSLQRRPTDGASEFEETGGGGVPLDAPASSPTSARFSRPDHLVEGYQAEVIVRECISNLEPDFREVLVLRDVEELSYDEIADVTGLAMGTVRSRLHRARTMLKAAVEEALHGGSDE
jgi:RNA polymerase sigma-70 factor, ECF subfamily